MGNGLARVHGSELVRMHQNTIDRYKHAIQVIERDYRTAKLRGEEARLPAYVTTLDLLHAEMGTAQNWLNYFLKKAA